MISTEMDFATEALPELQKFGIAKLGYDTAQFEPYSRRDQPDILFWPDSGPNLGVLFLVELRIQVKATRRLPAPSALRERRDLLQNSNTDLRFALATTGNVDRAFLAALLVSNIEVLDEIQSGEDLAGRILAWSEAAIHDNEATQFLLPIPRQEPRTSVLSRQRVSLNKSEQQSRRASTINPIPHEDLFWEIFGTASDSRPLQSWFSTFREYVVEERLEFVEDLRDFLRFLEAKVTGHQYTSDSTFNKENLRNWFAEFNRGKAGGKL